MSTLEKFRSFRRELHQFPEVSCNEFDTKKRVLNFMQQFEPDETLKIGKTGIIFSFHGNSEGKSITVRCELDALPIQEINAFSYASVHQGVSHKCGHDGHMAIVTHLAHQLHQKRPEKGTVHLLFQPAEENGKGAKEITQDRKYDHFSTDAIIALHNIPGLPQKEIVVIENEFTPAVKSIIVEWKGKTSHAAEPENGLNPGAAMAEFMLKSLEQSKTDPNKEDFFLVTPVYQHMGEKAHGISAGYGETHLTLRSLKNEVLETQSSHLEEIAKELGEKHNLNVVVDWTQEFNAINNDESINALISNAAEKLGYKVHRRTAPMKWGEDFGLFTELHAGAMFGLGAGEDTPALHNPDYDFPDELIEHGSSIFERVVRNFLK